MCLAISIKVQSYVLDMNIVFNTDGKMATSKNDVGSFSLEAAPPSLGFDLHVIKWWSITISFMEYMEVQSWYASKYVLNTES